MITVFERIPDLFVQMYDFQFQTWAREFRTRGRECAIVFRRRPGAAAILDVEGRPIVKGAWLTAEVDREATPPRVIIKPKDEHAAELIARHVREMQGHVLH